MKIAVTGSNGLVGTALQQVALEKHGYEFEFLTREDADLCDPQSTERRVRDIAPVALVHLAGWVRGIGGHQLHRWDGFELNTMINTNVLRAARLAGVKNIIAMGTGAVYSNETACPLNENNLFRGTPHGSEGGYAEAKRHMVRHLNIFGPNDFFNEEEGHVIPALISKFDYARRTGEPVVVWGNGSAVRDFVYSLDMARIIIALIDKPQGVINVGSGQALSILQVVEILKEIFEYDNVEFDRSRPNGAPIREYDLSRLGETSPSITPMKRALEETVQWYLQNREQARSGR